jgi:hypothetical protein
MPHMFQQRVQSWMMKCFGAEISSNKEERNHRFYEEATELVQSTGMTRSECHQLVDYTYNRPLGDPKQETGGVLVTLAAHNSAHGIDTQEAGEEELARINHPDMIEKIRAKQSSKPKLSPLPQQQEQSGEWRVAVMDAVRAYASANVSGNDDLAADLFQRIHSLLSVTPPSPKSQAAPQPLQEVDDCCPATGWDHRFGPHGPAGEQQCEHCGAPQPVAQDDSELVEVMINLREAAQSSSGALRAGFVIATIDTALASHIAKKARGE